MHRKILFLQYILKQETEAMVYKVFEAIVENPVKNDFVQTCEKYLDTLGLKLTFEEIGLMSKGTFKKLVKEKTLEASFYYLKEKKNKQ